MDLQAAKADNSATWKCAKLAAIFFFAMAGGLLVASLASLSGARAEASVVQNKSALTALSTSFAQGIAKRP